MRIPDRKLFRKLPIRGRGYLSSQMLFFGDSPGHALAVPPLRQSWAGTVFHVVLSAMSGHTPWGGLRPFSRDGVHSSLDKDLAFIWFHVHPQGLERVRVLAGRLCGHTRSQEVWPTVHAEHGTWALRRAGSGCGSEPRFSVCPPRAPTLYKCPLDGGSTF